MVEGDRDGEYTKVISDGNTITAVSGIPSTTETQVDIDAPNDDFSPTSIDLAAELRREVAVHAMHGLLAGGTTGAELVAQLAIGYADHLIKALEQG